MQQVQDCLDFVIETPDNNEIRARFEAERMREAIQDIAAGNGFKYAKFKAAKAVKLRRKAQRQARARNRA